MDHGCSGIGAILSTAAPVLPVLIIGKLINGVGIAFALHAAPAYLAEMGHPSIRGFLIGCAHYAHTWRAPCSCLEHAYHDKPT